MYDETNKQINSYVQQTIDLLEQQNNHEELFVFLSQLEGLNKQLYHNAKQYIDNNF